MTESQEEYVTSVRQMEQMKGQRIVAVVIKWLLEESFGAMEDGRIVRRQERGFVENRSCLGSMSPAGYGSSAGIIETRRDNRIRRMQSCKGELQTSGIKPPAQPDVCLTEKARVINAAHAFVSDEHEPVGGIEVLTIAGCCARVPVHRA